MDDIWVFGRRASQLRAVQVELQQALETLGLHINTGKTHVLEGDALVEEAKQLNHSAVDNDLRSI